MAKYDGLRKLERNKMLKKYKEDNPDLALREIGEIFGISESRVWRILNGNKAKKAEK